MLWKKFWLLFTVIWLVVSGLNVATILAFSPDEQEKAIRPMLLGIAVPAVLYAVLWVWMRFRRKPPE
jgi:hypothetical protein